MGTVVDISFLKHFENDFHLLSDFADFFCGRHLGSGESRHVYQYNSKEDWVVKIDVSGKFYNVAEWDTWNNIVAEHPKLAKWFAKPIRISSCGRVMLQEKTEPILSIKDKGLPLEIPKFFHDVKIENWGRIGKRVVCHDYANTNVYSNATIELIKANWWSLKNRLTDK